MLKIEFSKKELNRFLLLGENNTYIIDKNYPLIRAFKRKGFLSILCTLRIKKETTTIKLGDYPSSTIEDIYVKFSIAQKIAKSGNNPNLIFNKTEKSEGNTNSISLDDLLTIFINDKKISQKYINDIINTLKKNLGDLLHQPLELLLKKNLSNKIENLISLDKKGTAKNLLNYLITLCNFAVKIRHIPNNDQIIKILNHCERQKKKYKIELQIRLNPEKQRLIKKINSLDNKQVKKLNIILDNYLNEN